MSESLKDRLQAAMKDAMRAKEKERLGAIRLIQAGIKRREVDERIELDDAAVLAILEKHVKQARESIKQFDDASRTDLADKERRELAIFQEFLPAQMSEEEVDAAIDAAIAESGAAAPSDMGKVMKVLKPALQGKADMGSVSGRVKARLSSD